MKQTEIKNILILLFLLVALSRTNALSIRASYNHAPDSNHLLSTQIDGKSIAKDSDQLDRLTTFNGDGITPASSNTQAPHTPNNLKAHLDENSFEKNSTNIQNNSNRFNNSSSVPEPATVFLFGLGILGLHVKMLWGKN